MARVYVDNRNKQHARQCQSANGHHVQIGPGALGVPMDEAFTWKMHPDVVLSGNKVRVFKTAEEEEADKAKAEKDRKEKEAQDTNAKNSGASQDGESESSDSPEASPTA